MTNQSQEQLKPLPDNCMTNAFTSRTCERGTKGCFVNHKPSPDEPLLQQALEALEEAEKHMTPHCEGCYESYQKATELTTKTITALKARLGNIEVPMDCPHTTKFLVNPSDPFCYCQLCTARLDRLTGERWLGKEQG